MSGMEGRSTVAFRGATWASAPTFPSQHPRQPQLQQQPQHHTPLYHDPLSASSDVWTTQKSQANLPPSSLFVNHAAPLSSFSGFAAQTPRKQPTTSSSPSTAAATGTTNTHASFEEHVQSSLQGLFGRRSSGGAVGPWQPQKGGELGNAFGASFPGSRRSTMAARPPPLLPDVPQAPKKKYPPPRPNNHNALSSSSSASRYAPEFPATAAGSAVAQSEEDPNYPLHPIQRLERTSIFHDLLLLEDEEERETRHDVPLFPMDDDLHTAAAEEENATTMRGRGGLHITSSRFTQLPVMTHGETKLQWSTTTATSSSSSSSAADGQRWRAEADDDDGEMEEEVSSSRSIATTARPGSESDPEIGPQHVQGGGIARGGGLVHALQTFHEQSLSSSSWAANMMMGHPPASGPFVGAEEDVPPSPFALLQHRGSAAEVAIASTPTAQLMHGAYAREWLQLVAQSQSSLPDSTSRVEGCDPAARDGAVVHPHPTAGVPADDLLCDEGDDPDRGDTDSLDSHSTVAHRRSAHRNIHQEGGALPPPQQQRARRGGAACAKRQRDLDSDADDLDTSLLVDEAEETLESCIAEQCGLRLHPSRRNPHAAPSSAAPRSPTRGSSSGGGGSKYPTQHVPTQERLAVARQRFEQGWSSSWMPGGGEGSVVERPSHRFAPARRVEGTAQLQASCSSGVGASSESEKDGRLSSLRINNLTWAFPESKRGMFSTTTTPAAPRGAAGGEASVGTVRGSTTDGRLEAWLRDVPLPHPRDAQ